MHRSRTSVISSVFFAFSVLGAPQLVSAQDMPPIFVPPAPAPQATPAPVSPSAQAVIPPAAAPKPQIANVVHPSSSPAASHRVETAAEKRKFATLLKKLAAAHRETAHHETVHRVAARETVPGLPPGAMVPPPDYYSPGPYQRMVYGGPYAYGGGWGGYRRPYPYYP